MSVGTERLEINELALVRKFAGAAEHLLQRFYHTEMTDAELFAACWCDTPHVIAGDHH